jgi:hypothetical protein
MKIMLIFFAFSLIIGSPFLVIGGLTGAAMASKQPGIFVYCALISIAVAVAIAQSVTGATQSGIIAFIVLPFILSFCTSYVLIGIGVIVWRFFNEPLITADQIDDPDG